jgi:hypothetical protein
MTSLSRVEAVAELQAVWRVLSSDLDAALAYGRGNNSPYAQRALIRGHFALMEGLSYAMRQVTLASLQGSGVLSESEIVLLREERLTIDEQGRPRSNAQYLKFPESLLFSIGCYAKNHGATFVPDKSGPGWQALRNTVKVRDRITHPKSAASLDVLEGELTSFVEAASWWKKTMLDMFAACAEADAYWRKALGPNQGSP